MTSRTPFTADFETLDFDAIREHLARETRTPYGRELARDLLPSADPSEVRYRLRLTTEARHWLAEQGASEWANCRMCARCWIVCGWKMPH
ncbi:hypothetical protein [Chloracidobacterium aggregatum]|uniref:hypothetical protein n=1 Tax=Chloracidobacterium aggregatum TaxID=2851959 RepID=UPI001B8D5104|nr:hypothetical protein [Chloracidobacterium aggregatum]QUV90855.1 hypothetical protein J8C04_00055 [Chloracidobacterium sp. A]